MRRRPFLAALSAATLPSVAGCSAFDADSPPAVTPASVPGDPVVDTIPNSGRPQSLPDEPFARSSRVVLNTLGLRASLFPTRSRTEHGLLIAWFLTHATEAHPARVAVRFANTTAEKRRYLLDRPRPLGAARLTGDDGDLVLVPTASHPDADDAHPVERDSDGCWRLSTPLEPVDGSDEFTIPPGSSVGGEYALVTDAGSPCPGPGTYTVAGDLRFSVALWDADEPGPTSPSQFEGSKVPPLPTETTTDWFHNADATTALYLTPGTEAAELPARLSFTLTNRSRLPLRGNPLAWSLWKLDGDSWHRIAPTNVPERVRWLPVGARATWSVRLSHGTSGGTDAIDVGHIGGGRYAFASPYGRWERRPAALVDVDAPPVSVRPDAAIEAVGRTGRTVEVWLTVGTNAPQSPRVVVERANRGDRRLLPEQVMQFRALRNTLPYFDCARPDVRCEPEPMPSDARTVEGGHVESVEGVEEVGGVESIERVVLRGFDENVDLAGLRAAYGLPFRFRFATSSYRLTVTPAHATDR